MLTACGQRARFPVASDADIQKKLLGTWTRETNADGEQWITVNVYKPDGSYVAQGTIVGTNETRKFSEAGTFLVKGGVLILTMTNHSNTNARLPLVERSHIVRLDGRELSIRAEDRPDVEGIFRRLH